MSDHGFIVMRGDTVMSDNPIPMDVTHDREKRRFQIDLGNGQAAILDYHIVDGVYVYTHTEVPPAFRGRGIADRLAVVALDTAEAEGAKVIPACSFMDTYIRRHKHYAALLAT